KALDETLAREVAIKSLNPDLADPEVLKRFRAEAVTLARLNHPNIAMLFELTEHDGDLLMVMEFVRGETFEAISQRGPVPLDRSRDLCCQVLDALAHAHRAGIVHRDLKPANLMLTESGLVKVMDFGLARMVGTEHLTNDGFMVGTPAYMAPEQVLAEEIDGRADLYAMAVVFYRLLTSRLPFNADSGISMVHKHVHDAPTPLRAVRTELPSACEDIIGRALAKSPADRFQTAEDFKSALAALSVTGSSVSTAAPASGSRAALTPPSVRSSVLHEEPTVVLKMPVRRQLSIAVLVAAVILAGVPTVYLVWGSRATQPQPLAAAAGLPAPASPSGASNVAPASEKAPLATKKPEPPSRPPLPSISFSQIKLLPLNDDRPRDRDVLVTFDLDALDVADGTTVLERARYRDVIGLFHSHSREPQWAKPDGTPVPLAKIGGKFAFLKGASDWITVQTRATFIALHVPESELARLVSELETRTGTHVVRTR
ncbi:MAG TPA: serine/threonine-protein kinase, partial [Vicinamibacterales bacterium]|nr:serine/threonine-protein kinase [Vicinamibacterales bacterium]